MARVELDGELIFGFCSMQNSEAVFPASVPSGTRPHAARSKDGLAGPAYEQFVRGMTPLHAGAPSAASERDEASPLSSSCVVAVGVSSASAFAARVTASFDAPPSSGVAASPLRPPHATIARGTEEDSASVVLMRARRSVA